MTAIQKPPVTQFSAKPKLLVIAALVVMAVVAAMMLVRRGDRPARDAGEIYDAAGKTVKISGRVDRVICSGSGCLRLLTYLRAHDRIVAVDSIEQRGSPLDARPYAIANPQFKAFPVFGEFRGWDNPELIAGLRPLPQIIFKIAGGRGQDPAGLQAKINIPVVVLEYGNLTHGRKRLDRTLRIMGTVMGASERAEKVIAYFDALEKDLTERTRGVDRGKRPACYVAGLGHSGPHGLQSTDPSFAPFVFTNARNVVSKSLGNALSHAIIAKEQILAWDPEFIFVDVSTLRLKAGGNALDQLRNDPVYQSLSAVRKERVYGLFPSNSYNQNFGAVFANAYYVGKVLTPERFADVDPLAKAEKISIYLNGGPAFVILNKEFDGLAFKRIEIK